MICGEDSSAGSIPFRESMISEDDRSVTDRVEGNDGAEGVVGADADARWALWW